MGWVNADKEHRSNQSHPSLAQYQDKDSYWALLDTMSSIAAKNGTSIIYIFFKCMYLWYTGGTVAQVGIAWLLQQPAVSSVVIGARTVEQLEDNMKGATLSLSEEQV